MSRLEEQRRSQDLGGRVPGDGQGIFGCQRAWPGGPGAREKVVPPLRGRVGADDEVGNADLSGFLRVWVLETKFVDFFGGNLRLICGSAVS